MELNLKTNRLSLNVLSIKYAKFIFELVNTPEWKKYIGERNIKTNKNAMHYIQNIIDNPNITYWVVELIEQKIPVGIITLIKREYLDHKDIGFAFLPIHSKKGYAYEATKLVLDEIKATNLNSKIVAVTIPENKNSIELLLKLGFEFDKIITIEKEHLHLYSIIM
jgi:[ribosomal protein S5]-alanine N-acetyltransferase